MQTARNVIGTGVALMLLVSCGRYPADSSAGDAVVVAGPAIDAAIEPATAVAESPGAAAATALEQPAVWPAEGVVFATPEEAAADYVAQVLEVEPVLGEFQAGDSRSGEMEVLFPGEGNGGTPSPRSLLALRQLLPDDGWFVIAALSDVASITSPAARAVVPPGPVTVSGVARGFEGTVVVSAFAAGDADAVLDSEITRGGAFETPEPYSVTLDLSAATPGDVVALLVRGDTGLGNDPGDFASISIVVGEDLPQSR